MLAGCAHDFKYTPPIGGYNVQNSITLNEPKDQIWSRLVPAVSQTFFVINNLDKESGLINISYSGDPELFVDCGKIYSLIHNLAGKRVYQFPAATAYKEYEIWTTQPVPVRRKMDLDGRINIVLEDIAPEQTRVSVHARYVVEKKVSILNTVSTGYSVQAMWHDSSDSTAFNSGESGTLSGGTECRCNGELERQILALLGSGATSKTGAASSDWSQRKIVGYRFQTDKIGKRTRVPVYEDQK
jgi:hypothetical protein